MEKHHHANEHGTKEKGKRSHKKLKIDENYIKHQLVEFSKKRKNFKFNHIREYTIVEYTDFSMGHDEVSFEVYSNGFSINNTKYTYFEKALLVVGIMISNNGNQHAVEGTFNDIMKILNPVKPKMEE